MTTRTGALLTAPDDMLVRALRPGGVELRAAAEGATMPTMVGHFAVFDTWAEIDSVFEGRFLERFARGAFGKTFSERRDRIRALFQHGRDPVVGDKPLGPVDVLREDNTGAWYEVPLFDTAYNRELLPGLEAGQYGASFRFRPVVDEWNDEPGVSPHNPAGLPERTIREAAVYEFGPVTFPAYASATAGVRSLTDYFGGAILSELKPSELRDLAAKLEALRGDEPPAALVDPGAAAIEDPEPREHSDLTPAGRRARLIAVLSERSA